MANPSKPASSGNDLKREQDKTAKADPVGKPVEPEKVVPVDIPANEPYPTGGKK
jgi:hypothetical protein